MAAPGYTDLPSTQHFAFEFNSTLDSVAAQALGAALAATAEGDFATMSSWFGGLVPPGVPFDVKIDPGQGGGSNDNVKNIDLGIGATSDFVAARWVLVAEVSEIFMAAVPLAWNPGDSSGEGLSQLAANTLYSAEVLRLNGPQVWLDTSVGSGPARPDYVSTAEPKDSNFISFGCALLFLYYLRSQLGFEMTPIVRAAAGSLEGVYANLTQDHGAFEQFSTVLDAKFPRDRASGLAGSTNPFPLPSGRVLSAKQYLAASDVNPAGLGAVIRANRELGNLRALLNSNRPASIVA